jgi:serine-type D-Ala-D-Ala carboxypeptidase/endopeptidase (penicillin-binding protein 4)
LILSDFRAVTSALRSFVFFVLASLLLVNTPTQAETNPLDAFKRAGVTADSVGLYALALDQTVPKYAHNAETALILASTTKILTSVAALDVLGPAFKWRTNAYLNGKLENGILAGDLLIVGGGDPLLDSTKLTAWFSQLQKRGIKEIAGNIILDRQRFALNEKDHANTPKPDWRNTHHALPDAFVIDEGMLKVKVSNVTDMKVISFEPALDGIDIVDQTKSVGRCAAIKAPISVEFDESTANRKVVVTGEWAKDCTPVVVETNPFNMQTFSSAAVLSAWKAAGGEITGQVVEAPAPVAVKLRKGVRPPRAPKPRKPFASLESKQLVDAIKQVNKWSNNLVSRNVLLTLSPGFPNIPATLSEAQKNVANWLKTKGFSESDLSVENGSGLSRNERGKARALAELLRDVSFSKIDKVFRSSLSVAGLDGTMGGRLKRADMAGKALLKTGTLTEVRAVAGYVTGKSGQVYAVVALVNHTNATRAVPAIDAFVEWVYSNG